MKIAKPMINNRRRIHTDYRKIYTKPKLSGLLFLFIPIIMIIFVNLGFKSKESNNRTQGKVIEVFDGDTILVQSGSEKIKVRLLGVDTPETHHPTKPVGCYGPEASKFTEDNLLNKTVKLEFDKQRKDKYERTLAYVYLEGALYNKILIQYGYAKILLIPPNLKHAKELVHEEMKAEESRAGLWGAC